MDTQVLVGRYRLDERLGAGGMSVVWRARDLVLNREVAVKVLVVTDAAARTRIRTEAQAAAAIWHPHVTNVYDYGEAEDADGAIVPYIVMELLPGRTMQTCLAGGPMPARSALRACAEVAAGLAAAHAVGLVHRDVKPANVMLTPSGAKVFDFGIVAGVGHSQIDDDGLIYGTPSYTAPERLTEDTVSPAADVYSLGLLIYHALTGRLPLTGDSTTGVIGAHAFVEPEALPYISGVGPEVEDVYGRCLSKVPAKRPTAAEVAAVLAVAAGIVVLPDDLSDGAVPPLAQGDGPSDGGVPPAPRGDDRIPVARPAAVGERPPRRRRILVAIAVVALATAALAATAWVPDEPSAAGAHPSADARSALVSGRAPLTSPASSPTSRGTATPAPTQQASGSSTVVGLGPTSTPTSPQLSTDPPTPTPTQTQSPSPSPTPTSTPSTTSPSPGVTVSAIGGDVVVVCTGDVAKIVRATPADGYALRDYHPGPTTQVKATFAAGTAHSDIMVKCDNGVAVPTVREVPPR